MCYHSTRLCGNDQNAVNFWRRILPYLVLNVIVSAATTLLVLALWDRSQPQALLFSMGGTPAVASALPGSPDADPDAQIGATLPPLDAPVIEIEAVIGAGDPAAEALVLKRIGEGELLLTGWKISNGRGSEYIFPYLVLNKNGSVRLYTRGGVNSVIELYWGLAESVWHSGDTATLTDPQGNLRASFTVP